MSGTVRRAGDGDHSGVPANRVLAAGLDGVGSEVDLLCRFFGGSGRLAAARERWIKCGH